MGNFGKVFERLTRSLFLIGQGFSCEPCTHTFKISRSSEMHWHHPGSSHVCCLHTFGVAAKNCEHFGQKQQKNNLFLAHELFLEQCYGNVYALRIKILEYWFLGHS